MKKIVLIKVFLFLFSHSAFGKIVECSAFSLGAGVDNVGVYADSVELTESPSGESLIGAMTFEFPESVPLENNKRTDAENVYKLEVNLKHQENTSKWVRGQASIKGSARLSYKGTFLSYAEFDSNTLFNPSDKRRVDAGVVIGVNLKMISPKALALVDPMGSEKITVLGVDTTIKGLIDELGFQNAMGHFAAQKRVPQSLMSGVQLNCSH